MFKRTVKMKRIILSSIAASILGIAIFSLFVFWVLRDDAEIVQSETTFVWGQPAIFRDVDDLTNSTLAAGWGNMSANIVRVRVLGERMELFLNDPWISDVVVFNRVRVLEVFSGTVETSDIMVIRQESRRVAHLGRPHRAYVNTHLTIGDEFILFLLTLEDELSLMTNHYQAVFHVPPHFRGLSSIVDAVLEDDDLRDIVFESVHQSNKLILTAGNLLRIAKGEFYYHGWF
jgi:hypothetical protein